MPHSKFLFQLQQFDRKTGCIEQAIFQDKFILLLIILVSQARRKHLHQTLCLSRKANSNDKPINLLWKLFMHKMTSFCEESDVQIRHKLLHCPICSPLCPETFKTSHRGKHRLRGLVRRTKAVEE
ncbi:hypothetical protein TorRG33x02_163800 [Trema orientale]|uniref:Uncharacterized protein n=1 Tax=Trema orientale TaxID=63057 RepID=A0A2P5EQS6_TREOI|nr:hypothetical protein TorRG33x02_163800 [Trema orientale]